MAAKALELLDLLAFLDEEALQEKGRVDPRTIEVGDEHAGLQVFRRDFDVHARSPAHQLASSACGARAGHVEDREVDLRFDERVMRRRRAPAGDEQRHVETGRAQL